MMTSQKTNTNLALKVAIVTSGFTQRAVAQKAGMSELRLSQLVNRRIPVTADDKRILAKVLKRRQSELFPESETLVAS
jgi:transcriptional regulator with XRE-family HTH domain